MIVLLMKTLGGHWFVVCENRKIAGYAHDKFDAALQFAVGFCSNRPTAELQLDHDAVKEIEARYLKPCIVAS